MVHAEKSSKKELNNLFMKRYKMQEFVKKLDAQMQFKVELKEPQNMREAMKIVCYQERKRRKVAGLSLPPGLPSVREFDVDDLYACDSCDDDVEVVYAEKETCHETHGDESVVDVETCVDMEASVAGSERDEHLDIVGSTLQEVESTEETAMVLKEQESYHAATSSSTYVVVNECLVDEFVNHEKDVTVFSSSDVEAHNGDDVYAIITL